MAQQKISYIADLKFNISSGQNELLQMQKTLQGINTSMAGVGDKRATEAQKLAGDMNKLAAKDTTNMNRNELVRHQKEMNDLKSKFFKITNEVVGSQVSQLAKTQEEKDALMEINKLYDNKTKAVNAQLKVLDDLAKKTKEFKDSAEATAPMTGMSGDDLANPVKVKKALEGTMDTDGTVTKGQEAKHAALVKHLEVVNRLKMTGAETLVKWEHGYENANQKLIEAQTEQEKLRGQKRDIINQLLTTGVSEGKITEEQKQQTLTLLSQLEARESNTAEAKKTDAAMKTDTIKGVIKDTRKLRTENDKGRKSFLGKVTAATLYFGALRILRRVMRTVVKTVRELDKSITEVAMVTGMTRQRTNQLTSSYQRLAREVGGTTAEIAKLSVFFFRQGRTAVDALELTKVAATAAKVASIDATKSANFLTSAINGFGMAADQAMAVSDRFAALGASSASSYEEMAIALSKVAPVAKVAGVGIDFMMGVIAKGVETTREAPENIGTAFKTIFARMTQIRDFGATLDDSVGVNQVEIALKQANVALRDSSGNFRDMELVLTELGHSFDGLTRNQQSYIATALAGTRQQSRLLAVMQNFDRTVELVNISLTASGATLAQHTMFMEGMEGATARLTNAFQGLVLAFSDSDTVIKIVDELASSVEKLTGFVERAGKATAAAAGLMATAFVVSMVVSKIAVKLLTPEINKLTFAMVKAAIAQAALTMGMSLILPAIIAVVGALVLFLTLKPETQMEKMAKASAKMTKEAEKAQVAIFNLNKQGNDLKKLADRYDELNNKVIKTAEEIEELDEVGKRLKTTLEQEHNIVVTADISEDARLAMETILSKQKEALEISIDVGKGRFIEAVEEGGLQELQDKLIKAGQPLTPGDMDSLRHFAASEMFGVDFINAGIVEQNKMLDVASKNLTQFIKEQADFKALLIKTQNEEFGIVAMTDEFKKERERMKASGESTNTSIQGRSLDDQVGLNAIQNRLKEMGLMPEGLSPQQERNFMLELKKAVVDSGGSVTQIMPSGMTVSNLNMDDFIAMANLNQDVVEKRKNDLATILANFEQNKLGDGKDILGLADIFKSVLDGTLDEKEIEDFFEDLLATSDSTQAAVLSMTDGLGGLVGLSLENISTIIQQDIKDNTGRSLTGVEKSGIAQILEANGFSTGEIVAFFQNMENFTVEGIATFIDSIQNETKKRDTATALFGFLTDDAAPKKFNQTLTKLKNDTNRVMELQQKMQDGQLSGEDFDSVVDLLGDSELLEKFKEGTLTAEDFAGERAQALKDSIALAAGATMKEISLLDPNSEKDVLTLRSLNNQMELYATLLDSVDNQVFNSNMADFYQSQIDFITEMNQKIQEEIDLEQQRLDMNKSMLSLNRQIAALERDTSFGAQAKLEDLRMTRSQEAAQRESFIRDTIANQNIAELQNEIQSGIQTNTATSAEYLRQLVDLAGGQPGDFKIIEAQTGLRLGNSFNNRMDTSGGGPIRYPNT